MPTRCFIVEPIFRDLLAGAATQGAEWDGREILRWRNPQTAEEKQWPHLFGVGAMWHAVWYPKNFEWSNENGPHLIVMTPGGEWDIDSRASNCTMRHDRLHRCWVRHGQAPLVTVDKAGLSCHAGAGSIQCGSYHGFLRAGVLT